MNLREAHASGTNGKELEEKPGILQHVAHKLGRRAFERATILNNRLHDEKAAEFQDALTHAQGLNKDVLMILQEASKIPREHSAKPLWGEITKHRDGSRTQTRVLSLSFGEADSEVVHKFVTPVVGSLGSIHIDNPDWSHNGYHTPLTKLGIVSMSQLDRAGHVLSVSSELTINDRFYDPDNIVFDDSADFKGGSKLTIDNSGEVVEVGMARTNQTGYSIEDASRIRTTTPNLLKVVLESVSMTTDAYKALSQLTEGPESNYTSDSQSPN